MIRKGIWKIDQDRNPHPQKKQKRIDERDLSDVEIWARSFQERKARKQANKKARKEANKKA